MPTYDYCCTSCGHTLEAFQKITADPLKACPKCNNDTLQRGPGGGVGLSFSGSGFYITDYKQKKEDSCPCGEKPKSSCENSS